MVIRAGRDEVAVHGPVLVLAKREAVAGVVVLALGKRDEVGGADEANVIAGGELDAKAAGGALVVVDGEDLAATTPRDRRRFGQAHRAGAKGPRARAERPSQKVSRAAVFKGLLGDEGEWRNGRCDSKVATP